MHRRTANRISSSFHSRTTHYNQEHERQKNTVRKKGPLERRNAKWENHSEAAAAERRREFILYHFDIQRPSPLGSR